MKTTYRNSIGYLPALKTLGWGLKPELAANYYYFAKKVEFYTVFGYIICMVLKKKLKQVKKKAQKQPDYDSAWKDIIEEHFEPFLEFFFPHIHQDINYLKKSSN